MPSTVVAGMTYDPVSLTLRIKFVSGLVYDYKKVPPEVYSGLKESRAKGEYLNRHIKGCYDFEKV